MESLLSSAIDTWCLPPERGCNLSGRTQSWPFMVAPVGSTRAWSTELVFGKCYWMGLREGVFNLWWIKCYVHSCCPGLFSSLLCCWAGICYVWWRKKNDREYQGGSQNSWLTQMKWSLGSRAFVLGGEELFALGDWGNESYFNNII